MTEQTEEVQPGKEILLGKGGAEVARELKPSGAMRRTGRLGQKREKREKNSKETC